ncbi:hypothetical protein SAMN05660816_03126 [Niastella yeongjuensis]|nr:hypothetical protein SAMN05660816_03126 [Niastella yeongjuensis]
MDEGTQLDSLRSGKKRNVLWKTLCVNDGLVVFCKFFPINFSVF